MLPRNYALPDPWFPPDIDYQGGAAGAGGVPGTIGSVAWAVANAAIFVPVIFPCNATLYSLSVLLGTPTDNYDLGFYRDDMVAVARKGSTAVAAGTNTLSLPDYRVRAGDLYYMAYAQNGNTSTVFRFTLSNTNAADLMGQFTMASGFPLPDPAVPELSGSNVMPLFAFGVR